MTLASTVLKKSIFQKNSLNALGSKFDLEVKKVSLLVLEKNIFKGFLPYMGEAVILVM